MNIVHLYVLQDAVRTRDSHFLFLSSIQNRSHAKSMSLPKEVSEERNLIWRRRGHQKEKRGIEIPSILVTL